MIPDRFTRHQGGAEALEEGFWLIQRRRARRVDIPVRIWFGPPDDPDTGEPMDRSWRWRIQIAGYEIDMEPIRVGNVPINDVTDFWPSCRTDPIGKHEHDFRIARQNWAAVHDENDPFGTPGGRIDPMTATLPFME